MTNVPAFIVDNIQLIGLLIAVSVGIIVILIHDRNTAKCKVQNESVYFYDFLDNWDRYRQGDMSGCYIILIWYKKPSLRMVNKKSRYDQVYIGQSVNMYKRVYNHLTGHGNGDVYADVRNKRFVYVTFVPCKPKKLNVLEKSLIEEYDAIHSYNRTKGGSKLTLK